ncbi:MAG: type I glutamate--ammonia ligase [Bifidobacteriaceae bacterium]|jgi:glutamine synthetase|nr:type I glutamate--ammonia ligase [Bifidobacteriaceae bacterium]
MDKKKIVDLIEKNNIRFINVRFIDLPGVQQHLNIPSKMFLDSVIADGLAFDGSSIKGFQTINESDLKLVPDFDTAYIDPFKKEPTLAMSFSVVDPITNNAYEKDPRQVAFKTEEYIRSTGIADQIFFAPEAEFYIFDDVRFNTSINEGYYSIDSTEGAWNTGTNYADGNSGHRPKIKGGYFPVPPVDQTAEIRDEIVANLQNAGFEVERSHHEVGTAGQQEVNYKFSTLTRAADDLMTFKYIVKNTCFENGQTATFLPKPLFDDNGSGMHCHQSLWKKGKPLFFESGKYGDLSDIARWYIGGIIKHAPSILAFTNPTTNSYRRLVPGFEAPTYLVYSARNRSAAIRIPITGSSPAAKRIEFRIPDPSSNPYLAFSAQALAGIDGVINKIEPPKPVDGNLYAMSEKALSKIKTVPDSLEKSLDALKKDYKFLLAGGCFTEDLIQTWIDYKQHNEIDYLKVRPTPGEFELYFDI